MATVIRLGDVDLTCRLLGDRNPNPKPLPYLHLWGWVRVVFLCLISPAALRLGVGVVSAAGWGVDDAWRQGTAGGGFDIIDWKGF